MVDYNKELKSLLSTLGLPVYYELWLTKDTKMPCISYMLGNDVSLADGDTLRYSEVTYNVKVWSDKVSELSQYSVLIDKKMREAGFKRIGSTELWLDGVGQLQLRYRGTAYEKYIVKENN